MYSSPPMQSVMALTRSTVGQKAVVAVTGVILFGFVIGHLLGNLLVFAGPEAFNEYAWTLKHNPPLLWGTRIVLLTSVVLHISLTMQLAKRNQGARATSYKKARKDQITTYAARSMILTGPLLAAYIVFHLLHFTVPGLDFGRYDFSAHDPYANLVHSFRWWPIAATYMFASLMLGLHIYHGGWSAFQSIGLQHEKYDKLRTAAAAGLAIFLTVGNIAIPVSVLARVVGTDAQLTEAGQVAEQLQEEH